MPEYTIQELPLIVNTAENMPSNICREMTKLTSIIHKVGNVSVCLLLRQLHKQVEATLSLKLAVSVNGYHWIKH